MRHHFPATPVKDYRAPTFTHGLKIKAAINSAALLRYWDYPRANSATASEEMTFTDRAYRLYKCARPIIRAEKEVSDILSWRDKPALKLPDGFKKDTSVTIGAAGDLIPVDGLESSKDILFENIADVLFGVDISFANLEAPVTERNLKEPLIFGRPPIMYCSFSQFSTLAGYRGKYFTVLNFANNHTFDAGIEGIETTQALLLQKGILDIGTPRGPQEYGRAKILTKGGIKIGFISATFGLNGHQLPVSETYRIHTAKLMSKYVVTDLELLRKQIEDSKKQGCDFIIASIHWGHEFEFFPRLRQIEAAHTLIEEGVDLILGHHPHVIQPLEYYRTKRDVNRTGVIAYSLGGLTFGWYTAPHLVLGMILNVRLSKGLLNGAGHTYIERIEPVPVFQSFSYQDGIRSMRVERLQGRLKERSSYQSAPYLRQIARYAELVLEKSITL